MCGGWERILTEIQVIIINGIQTKVCKNQLGNHLTSFYNALAGMSIIMFPDDIEENGELKKITNIV